MNQESKIEVRKTIELFRPRAIESDPSKLRSEVGLFGTCGSPASTWRQDIFIPELEKRGLSYFNPQVEEWSPEMAQREAEHMATDEVIVLLISKETHGYGSLAEGGWAILSTLLRGQKLGIYVEEDETMSEDARLTRTLFKILAEQIQRDYPVFQFENSMEDLAQWAAITMKERAAIRNSKIKDKRKIELPTDVETNNVVGIFGTTSPTSEWKQSLKSTLDKANIAYFDPYKEDWAEEDARAESEHKLNDRVLLQVITGETESLGSLAESGLLALSAFIRGQTFGLYIEDHPSDPKSDTNRTRALVRAHVQKLNEQFPSIVFLANSIEELQEFAIQTAKKGNSIAVHKSVEKTRGEIKEL
ncbi:MAG: hypothetical protein HQ536_01135 [Parcubacteria group bacterium]|nr:hypothetical protein [Parcubacteria group bacterium]